MNDEEAIQAGQEVFKEFCEVMSNAHEQHKYVDPPTVNSFLNLAILRLLIQNIHMARQLTKRAPMNVKGVEDDPPSLRGVAEDMCGLLSSFFGSFDERSIYEFMLVRKDKGFPEPGEN